MWWHGSRARCVAVAEPQQRRRAAADPGARSNGRPPRSRRDSSTCLAAWRSARSRIAQREDVERHAHDLRTGWPLDRARRWCAATRDARDAGERLARARQHRAAPRSRSARRPVVVDRRPGSSWSRNHRRCWANESWRARAVRGDARSGSRRTVSPSRRCRAARQCEASASRTARAGRSTARATVAPARDTCARDAATCRRARRSRPRMPTRSTSRRSAQDQGQRLLERAARRGVAPSARWAASAGASARRSRAAPLSMVRKLGGNFRPALRVEFSSNPQRAAITRRRFACSAPLGCNARGLRWSRARTGSSSRGGLGRQAERRGSRVSGAVRASPTVATRGTADTRSEYLRGRREYGNLHARQTAGHRAPRQVGQQPVLDAPAESATTQQEAF